MRSILQPSFLVACFLISGLSSLQADNTVSPLVFDPQFQAQETVTGPDGKTSTIQIRVADGKIRTESTVNYESVATIFLPDQKIAYLLMIDRKVAVRFPFDPAVTTDPLEAAKRPRGSYEADGNQTVEGTNCLKFRVTASDGKVGFIWIDAVKKTPVQTADTLYTRVWKNYQPGPQDATLFEPPDDFRRLVSNRPLPPSTNLPKP